MMENTMKKILLAMVAATAIILTGCNSNQTVGTVVGGALGGALGNQVGGGSGRVVATVVGTVIGSAIGGNIGRTMDQVDRRQMAYTLESQRDMQPTYWRNPNTGYEYQTTPTRTYQTNAGYCREYRQDAWIGGKKQSVYGTACRQPDGSWQIQN